MTVAIAEKSITSQTKYQANIAYLNELLERKFSGKLTLCRDLSRLLVSFQGNKNRSSYRWYKYKEGFSASLIDYFLNEQKIETGTILDPFAGSGTTLFAATERGLDADGIEILPISQKLIEKRNLLENEFGQADAVELEKIVNSKNWQTVESKINLNELRITRGAYPPETKAEIEKYLTFIETENRQNIRDVLELALYCVLESVSYTRKDGQYLRWDDRSGKRDGVKKPFNKGNIPDFSTAISTKIKEISDDLLGKDSETLFKSSTNRGNLNLLADSCLEIMPDLSANSYAALITSPPYCNRYDYTRTYALELALLRIDEKGLTDLRQSLLSCTVENKAKDLLRINPNWQKAVEVADSQKLLQEILKYLETEKNEKRLNNTGILRMVRGYFYEMACVIAESARVLKPNAPLIMVNDNVRYAGVSISVDLILSDFAEKLGFAVEKILVLPNGKGNSSQQMGRHGREELRKCVYVWRKI
jgi:DNA modification methylase